MSNENAEKVNGSPPDEWHHSIAARRLNERGQCCGRKPLPYKGGPHGRGEKRHKFCDRCNRAFHFDTGEQIENWAYKADGDGYFRVKDCMLKEAMK